MNTEKFWRSTLILIQVRYENLLMRNFDAKLHGKEKSPNPLEPRKDLNMSFLAD